MKDLNNQWVLLLKKPQGIRVDYWSFSTSWYSKQIICTEETNVCIYKNTGKLSHTFKTVTDGKLQIHWAIQVSVHKNFDYCDCCRTLE